MKRIFQNGIAITIAWVCLLISARAQATVWIVNKTADTNDGETVIDCSLREAIAAAGPGDLILFSSLFNSPQTIRLRRGQIVINKNITIGGPGADKLTIRSHFPPQDNIFTIDHVNGTVTLDGMTIDGNRSGYTGIRNLDSQLFVTHCVVSGNLLGGITSSGGNLFILNSTLCGNSNTSGGGGIDCRDSATLMLQNSTISGNSSNANGDGAGGIWLDDHCPAEITCCTIYDNGIYSTGPGAGGIKVISTAASGALTVANSIIALNWTIALWPDIHSEVVGGYIVSNGYNLIAVDDTGGVFTAVGDQTGTANAVLDPMLDDLDYYRGTTLTHRLHPGSPAIDQGKRFGLNNDQREFARPHDFASISNAAGGDGSDIGAYEVELSLTVVAGHVLDPLGDPIRGAWVYLYGPEGKVHRARTNAQGKFHFQGVPSYLTYTVVVVHEGYQFDPQTVILPEDGISDLVFRAKP